MVIFWTETLQSGSTALWAVLLWENVAFKRAIALNYTGESPTVCFRPAVATKESLQNSSSNVEIQWEFLLLLRERRTWLYIVFLGLTQDHLAKIWPEIPKYLHLNTHWMKGRIRNSERFIFCILQNEIFLLCRMFHLQYGIVTLHWKRAEGHYAFSFESHRKEHSPLSLQCFSLWWNPGTLLLQTYHTSGHKTHSHLSDPLNIKLA